MFFLSISKSELSRLLLKAIASVPWRGCRGIHRDSIMRLGVRIGQGCACLHDRLMRDLQVNLIELDAQWDFIAKKQRHVKQGDPDECGDV
jgi:hypothetical protein